jgi:hypothetical protein
MKRLITAMIVMAVLVTAGAGCSKPPIPLSTRTHLVKPNDYFEYSVESEVRFHKQQQTRHISGVRTGSVIQTTLGGKQVLCECHASKLTATNGYTNVHEWKHYMLQDATTRACTTVGDTRGKDGALRSVENPAIGDPGNWSASTTISNQLKFSNGDTCDVTSAVVGSEVVATPVGKFTCWKLQMTGVWMENGKKITGTGTRWCAPHVGVIKGQDTYMVGDEMTDTATWTLRATNIPLDVTE